MPNSLTLTDGRLDENQIQSYKDNGFLFPIKAVAKDRAQAWREELEKIENEWIDNGLPHPLSTYKRVNTQIVLPLANEIARTPAILDAVEGILGPDVMVYAVEFFIKEPNTTHIVSMHQDLTYWGLGATGGLVTAWLALSPATSQSGCMDFVAGSHKNEILPHNDTFDENNLLSRGQEIEVEVKEEDKTPIELAPGQMSLHHGLTIHGSGPNASDDRRIGAVIRYCSPDVMQQEGDEDFAILVRGEDRFGNFSSYELPDAPFTPESLAIFDRIRTVQATYMMKGARKKAAMYQAEAT